MSAPPYLAFKRSRFSTRLPLDRVYTRSHYWLQQTPEGLYRVGFTKFATRMLGDVVEYQFEVAPGDAVSVGQKIAWIEGFKAVSDIYSVVEGTLHVTNGALKDDITLIENDPYFKGWLYEAKGAPEPESMDAQGYSAVLDATIEKMLASRHDNGYDDGPEDSGDV